MSEYPTESSSSKCWKRRALHSTDIKTNISLNKSSLKDLWMSSMSKMLSKNNSTDIEKYTTKSSGSPCSTMPVTSKSSIADVQLEWEADMINGLSSINPT